MNLAVITINDIMKELRKMHEIGFALCFICLERILCR